jgi:GT2 family glycosyltransferase
MKDKIAIGWLDPGTVDGMFCLSIAGIYAQRTSRIESLIRVESGGLLSRGRNELVARFMDHSDAEWLLMLDSDEQLSVAGFDKLVAAAHDDERPVVAGLYFGAWPSRDGLYPEACPLIFEKVPETTTFKPIANYPQDTLIEVDSAGTGCLLIHRSVLECFRRFADPKHEGKDWCWFRDMPVNGDWFSEDHFFCARAQTLGYKVHAHTGVVLPHRKRFWLTDKHHGR